MLTGNNTNVRQVNGVNPNDMQHIRDFLQGSVYCWCNVKGEEEFAARDLVGGDNSEDWDKTPLYALYQHHVNAGKSPKEAFDQSGIDVGHILKSVLKDDNRMFKTKVDSDARYDNVRKYCWIPDSHDSASNPKD